MTWEEQHLFEPPAPVVPPPPAPVLVSGTIKVRLHFEADVAALARLRPQDFEAAGTEKGYQPWEKGSVFLWSLVNDQLEVYLATVPDALWDRSSWTEPEIEFRWTRELADQLDESLGVAS